MLINRGNKRAHLLTQQTKITVYSLPTKENNFRFLCIYILKRQHIDIYRNIYIYTYLYVYVYVYVYIYIYIYILPFQMENGKRKPGQFSLVWLPFAHSANWNLSLVRLFTKKQTKVPFANGLNRLYRLARLLFYLVLKNSSTNKNKLIFIFTFN